MGKYEALAKEIIKQVGGKENIISLTHCVTRLRFQLSDDKKAQDDVLKKMDGVVTVMRTGAQYQVVIGNHVAEVYKDVCAAAGLGDGREAEEAPEKKMSPASKLIDIMSGVTMPFITMMSACGIIKGINALLAFAGLYAKTDGWYILFNSIGDSIFYFLPIILGYTSAKKFKCNVYMGMVIGGFLCHPAINNADIVLLGNTFNVSYTSTVLPVILVVALAARVEAFFKKRIPTVVNALLTPACTMVIVLPLGFTIIGPVANFLSQGLAAVMLGIYNINPLIAGIVIAGFYQIMVIFGVHSVYVLSTIMNVMNGYPDPLGPLNFGTPFAQTAVVMAVWVKTKNKKLKEIALPAWISGLVAGVTEPAIYGVTLPRKRLFAGSCAAASIAGFTAALLGLTRYTMAGSSLLYIPGMMSQENPAQGLIGGLIVFAVAMVSGFVIGFILFKDDPEELAEQEENVSENRFQAAGREAADKKRETIASPIEGEVIPLSEVEDAAFSSGVLGRGIAIRPSKGVVTAPFDGTVVAIFPTGHAIGLVSDEGCEILIHIGMNTVQLEGRHFKILAEQGQKVKKGQKLITFDKEAIEKEGYSLVTPVLVTNTGDYLDFLELAHGSVAQGEPILTLVV